MQFIVTGYDGTDDKALEEEWLDNEPYVLGKVWAKIEITGAKVAPLWDK